MINVVVVGKPRCGKTALINAIVGNDVEVQDIPKTTHYEWFSCDYAQADGTDLQVQLVDTYSERNLFLQDQFYIDEANIILFVYSGTSELAKKSILDTLKSIYIVKRDVKVIIVATKCDRDNFIPPEDVLNNPKVNIICSSAKLGVGIGEIRRQIVSKSLPSTKSVLKLLTQEKPAKLTKSSSGISSASLSFREFVRSTFRNRKSKRIYRKAFSEDIPQSHDVQSTKHRAFSSAHVQVHSTGDLQRHLSVRYGKSTTRAPKTSDDLHFRSRSLHMLTNISTLRSRNKEQTSETSSGLYDVLSSAAASIANLFVGQTSR